MTDDAKKDAVILRPQEVNTKLESYKGQAHLLTPYARTKFDNIMQGFVPVIRETFLDPDVKNKEVYNSPEGGGLLAPSKLALQKLSKLAGVKWVYTRRMDDRKDAWIAAYVAKGTVRDVDGNVIEETKSGEYNLHDGTPQAEAFLHTTNGKSPKRLEAARQHICALAETKAMDRVIRALLGLKGSYTADELKKPFVILKLALDPNDERVAKMLQEEEAGISRALGFTTDDGGLSEIPPGTEGLDVGSVPGDKPGQNPPPGTGPIIDVKAESVSDHTPQDPAVAARQVRIQRCEDLYYMTGLTRGADKAPIKDLSDADLEKLEKALLTKPVVRQLPSKEEDII
jgi:hypothetical protein